MHKPILTTLALLFFFSISGIAQNQKYQSRFWKISKAGHPDSYLYGTMHVSDKIAFNLSDSFYKALQSVKTVGLESNPSEWLDSFNTFENASSFSGTPRFNTSASRGFYQNTMTFRNIENNDVEALLKTQSGILNAMLYRESSYNKEYQEDTWLEMHIYQTASKNNIPVVSLEGFTESRDLVTRASYEEYNNEVKKIVPKWLEDILKEKNRYTLVEDAYRKGDLDMIDTLNRVFNSPGYYKYMLTERNRNQVNKFMEYEAKGAVFMAVGAAHLPGTEGVIEMLRSAGYSVTPITDARTNYAKAEKDRLDSEVAPVSYSRVNAPNGTFSMIWTDKLFGNTSGYTNSTIGYDLSNGVYFINEQMNTYGPLYGLTQEQMLLKTDSLLFENIPGDIKTKERITTNGIPGILIKNVTRTGNYEQYQIYATPFQLSMFKLSGRKDRIGNIGDSIFNTLALKPVSNKWSTQKFVSGQFEVDVPEYRVMNIIDPIQTMYANPYLQAFDNSDKSYYLVKRISVHDQSYIEEDDFESKRFAQKLIDKMDYEEVNITNSVYDGYPSADFTAKTKNNQYVHGRIILQQQFYYFMLCVNGKKKFGPNKFFNSLKFTESNYVLPSKQFMDTVMKANVYASPLLNERYLLERTYRYSNQHKDAHKEITKSKNYYSENDELISVERKIFGKYDYYEKVDSLWKEIVEDYTKRSPYFIVKQNAFEKNGMQMLDLQLSDSGSIKTIYRRFVLSKNEDVLFSLKYLSDSISPKNNFVKLFYENFEPMDTVIYPSIFSNKARLVIEDYLSDDEETHKEVLSYIDGYTFYKRPKLEKADLNLMIRALNENPYEAKEPFMEAIFIKMLGDIESDSCADILTTLYKENEDNYPTQLAALSALAKMKNSKASASLQSILENDQPFISPSDASIFYSIVQDSSRLKNKMYLTLLEKMPDIYKSNIYNALSWVAVDSNGVLKTEYTELLDDIIKRYQFELKKSKVAEQIEKLEKSKKESQGGSSSRYSSYTSYSYSDYSSSFSNFYRLLLPYDSIDKVKKLLMEADELSSYSNIYSIQNIRENYKRPINEEKVKEMFTEEEKILTAYKFLIEIEQVNLLPDSLNDQSLFAKYALNYRRKQYDLDKDTIKQLKTEVVDGKKGKMLLYYYQINEFKDPKKTSKYKMNDPSYKIVCVGFNLDESALLPTKYDFSDYVTVDSEEKVDDAYEELKESAEIDGRKRAKPSKGSGSSYYDYDY